MKKALQKQIKKGEREKVINYILNGKTKIVLLTVGFTKKTKYK